MPTLVSPRPARFKFARRDVIAFIACSPGNDVVAPSRHTRRSRCVERSILQHRPVLPPGLVCHLRCAADLPGLFRTFPDDAGSPKIESACIAPLFLPEMSTPPELRLALRRERRRWHLATALRFLGVRIVWCKVPPRPGVNALFQKKMAKHEPRTVLFLLAKEKYTNVLLSRREGRGRERFDTCTPHLTLT